MFEVHISDIRAFKTCRRQWVWSSPLGGNLEPDKPYAPFFTGRIVHTALELYYRCSPHMSLHDAVDAAIIIEKEKMEAAGTLWEEEENLLNEQIDMVWGIMEHYEIWINSKSMQRNDWGDPNLEFLDMETTFSVPIVTKSGRASNRVFLGGRFDGIVRRRDDGSLWLFETKTARSITELQNNLPFDEQAGAYILAAQKLMGERVYGVIYNILRKKVPTKPRVLQNGELSQNKSIDTTVEYYWEAVLANHPNATREELLTHYGDILSDLYEKGNQFFTRTIVRKTPYELEELTRELHVVSLEMVRPSTPLYPSPSWTACTFCRFRGPCLALNAGADYQSILDAEYRQRQDRELRPYLLYGYHFVPIAPHCISVWYYGNCIVYHASSLSEALSLALQWAQEQAVSNDGYFGPDAGELFRGAKEVGLWQGA